MEEDNPLLKELEADFLDTEGLEEQSDAEDATPPTEAATDLSKLNLKSVNKLVAKLLPVIEEIQRLNSISQNEENEVFGSLDNNPAYKLVVESNSLASQIDDEMVTIYKFIADRYSTRFPTLDTLVNNRMKYISTVAIIGNGPFDQLETITNSTDNPVGKKLRDVLDGPTVLNVRMEAATSKGHPLDADTLELVIQACKTALELDQYKGTLTTFVQRNMPRYAPNMTALIGAEAAAQMVNAAGGLSKFAAIPSANLASVGNSKQRHGAANLHERQGYLYFSPIIKDVPTMHRQMAIKRLAPKVSLSARMDLSKENREGEYGRQLRQQVLDAIDRLTEPPANQGVRALPVPDDKPSKKRGGRKARADKNRNAYTELAQAQNRMAFGQEEQEVMYGDESIGMGMVSGGEAGRIRAFQVDERTKAKLSKKNAGWGVGNTSIGGGAKTLLGGTGRATGLRTSGVNAMPPGTTGVTGTTMLNFDQHQGLSLADPGALEAEQRKAKMKADDKYFEGGSFTRLANGTGGQNPLKRKAEAVLEKDKDGFKKPALPSLKRLMKLKEEKKS